jgi:hypothetical protein
VDKGDAKWIADAGQASEPAGSFEELQHEPTTTVAVRRECA